MASIIFIQHIYKERIEKRAELQYYKNQLEVLQDRIRLLNKELELTDQIINVIEFELKNIKHD